MKKTLTYKQLKRLVFESMNPIGKNPKRVHEGSLDRVSMDEISKDVRDWYDEHGDDLTDEQLNAVVDGTDENNEVFNGMLRDLGLTNADEEVKEAAYQALRDDASTELSIRATDMDEATELTVKEGTGEPSDDQLISEFTAEWVANGLDNLDNMMDYMRMGGDSDKRKCWLRLGRQLREISMLCDENAQRVWKR